MSWRLASGVVLSSPSSNVVVTTVLKRLDLDEKISKEGRAESGVCRSVRVVNGMVCSSDGNGPVTVGYSPVQYEIVVVMLGEGKTKLTAASPNEIIFVTARKGDKEVWFKPGGEGEVTTEEVLVVKVNVEVGVLGETTPELRSDVDAVVSVWMLIVPSVEVELACKELELKVELVMVFEVNSKDEEDVEFLLIEDEEFVLGNRVGNPVEALETSMLVKDALTKSDSDVELEIRTEFSEEDGTESDSMESVGAVIEILSTLLMKVRFELAGAELIDEMPEFVASDEVRLLDDVTEELPVLLARLGLGLSRFEVPGDVPAGEDNLEEGLGRDTVKLSFCVGDSTEELTEISVPVR
ncbi:hypothetical protein G6011_08473 [Alternaria panax]|uniref:Uncharacterized protein n=1 Tax=Alternaria panax TaxID=48097 RepID=A0AAD4FJ83_9PLEO|nr:hypothetical protein G6011_08473 [Alternaria panax]